MLVLSENVCSRTISSEQPACQSCSGPQHTFNPPSECECEEDRTHMVVLERVCMTRWDSELEEGVFTIFCCSGVVRGPKMLTTI